MKRYESLALVWLGILSLLLLFMLSVGVILFVIDFSDITVSFGLVLFGGVMGIFCSALFFAEKSRYLTVNGQEISLPMGVFKNGKIVAHRTVIGFDTIASMKCELSGGEWPFTADTHFYTLILHDGTEVRFTLSGYGKRNEQDIVDILHNRISKETIDK